MIRALDEIIADEAEDVVAGEFESIDQVLDSAQDPAAVDEPAAAPAAMAADPSAADAATMDLKESAAAHDAPEGDFEAPDALSAEPSATASTASANDPAAAAGRSSPLRAMLRRRLASLSAGVMADATYRLLKTANQPLMRLSPELRNTVGYVAILTAFNALCLIAYGALT